MENISDCSIREYQSIVATIMGHQALSPGINQWLSVSYPTICTYKDGLFQQCCYKRLFLKFHQKLHLVFVIIKLALVLRFTNTFYVRLVPNKNFRTIAPTIFLVGMSTNWLNFLSTVTHIFLNFTANHTKFL